MDAFSLFAVLVALGISLVGAYAYGSWGSQLWSGQPVKYRKVLAVVMFVGAFAFTLQSLFLVLTLSGETALWFNRF